MIAGVNGPEIDDRNIGKTAAAELVLPSLLT